MKALALHISRDACTRAFEEAAGLVALEGPAVECLAVAALLHAHQVRAVVHTVSHPKDFLEDGLDALVDK